RILFESRLDKRAHMVERTDAESRLGGAQNSLGAPPFRLSTLVRALYERQSFMAKEIDGCRIVRCCRRDDEFPIVDPFEFRPSHFRIRRTLIGHSQQHCADLFVGRIVAEVQSDGHCLRVETISEESSARLDDCGAERSSLGQGLRQDCVRFESRQLSCLRTDLSNRRRRGPTVDYVSSRTIETS